MPKPARNPLAQTIGELRQSIARLRRRGSDINEDGTRRVLVDPLISALQWNTLDVEEVRTEYRHKSQDNPVDYALFMFRTPQLFVEAKALGKTLDDRKWISQTIGYAATVGVEWCVLTNGDEYRLYNAHAALDAEEKLFRTVKVSDESASASTLDTLRLLSKPNMVQRRLDVLWKVEFVDKRVKVALERLLSQKDEALVLLLKKRAHGLEAKDVRSSLGRALVHIDFPVVSVEIRGRRSAETRDDKRRTHAIPERHGVQLSDLIRSGQITLPFRIEATWRKQPFTATITGPNAVVFKGNTHASLSVAAGMARNIANGLPGDGRKYWQTNGWTFWKYRDPKSGALRPLSDLRKLLKS
jgi:predicted type IV restriction endonuclease